MSVEAQEILKQALALPADSRATIAAKLLESLDDKEQQENNAAWAKEAESRLAAYDQGLMAAIPGKDVIEGLSQGRNK
jgi:putative addiction module component (TIGR02574 family)